MNPNTAGVFYQYDPNGNLLWQQTVSAVSGGLSTGFLERETATHYYWLPNEHGDILVGFDQGINSYAVYTDHLNTPRLVTKIENPQNPRAETDTANDLPQAGYGEPQGISPLAIPVWQWSYSPFGADLANGYEARPTTIGNNFKPDLWTWTGLSETGGADPNQVAQETWRIQANLNTPPALNIRYPGQYYDFEVGLVQNWWRTYEPRISRYVSTDPIGLDGGWNRFGYAYQDGVNYFDRDGKFPMAAFAIAAIGLSVAINDTVDSYYQGKAEACNRAVLERIKKQYENSCRKPTSDLSASDIFVMQNNPNLIRSSAMKSGYSALSQAFGAGLEASKNTSESLVHGSGFAKSPINFLPSPIAHQYGISSGCELFSGDL